jgi:hypothetical protein
MKERTHDGVTDGVAEYALEQCRRALSALYRGDPQSATAYVLVAISNLEAQATS